MDSIAGKVALVTGASQGLGRVIAIELAKLGCRVVINYANNSANAEQVKREIEASGGDVRIARCDVGDETAVNEMFRTLGAVDILVNNARLDPWRRTAEISEGEWFDQVMRVNLKGAFLSLRRHSSSKRSRATGGGSSTSPASAVSGPPSRI